MAVQHVLQAIKGQILLHQAPQAIDEIAHTFNLSAGERQFLLSADRGQGLLSSGTQRVAFQAISSPTEHHLVTSDPAELANYAEDRDFADSGSGQAYVDLGPAAHAHHLTDGDEFGSEAPDTAHIDLESWHRGPPSSR